MKLEQNKTKEKISKRNTSDILVSIITWFLAINGLLFYIDYIVYVFSVDDRDIWFSSLEMSVISFGFAGILLTLRKKNN